MKAFLFLLAFLTLGYVTIGGHIYGWEMEIEYPNAKFAKNFRLFFQLENILPSNGYIEVRFPFCLGANPTPIGKLSSLRRQNQNVQIASAKMMPTTNLFYFFNFGNELGANL